MMKNTFKHIYTLMGGLAISCALQGCVGDLDRYPTNDVTGKEVYSTKEGTMQALAKVYGAWSMTENDVVGLDDGSTGFVRNFWNLQELSTEEAICAWSDPGVPDIHNMNWSSSNPFVQGLYYRSLTQIKFANEFLINIGSSAVDAKEKEQMSAEARFIRAYQYWVLMDCFGNPPFIDETMPTGKFQPKQILRPELFKYIESELKDIEGKLIPTRQAPYGRVDAAAAQALLARLYLNAEVYTGTARWSDAAAYAEKVINSGYTLMPKYAHLFYADNNEGNTETILAIGFDGKKSQSYSGSTFLVHAAANPNTVKYLESIGLHLGFSGGWGGNRATLKFASFFDKDDSRKLMKEMSASIEDPKTFDEGVHVYKFLNIKKDGSVGSDLNHADNDFPLFRLSEMYLIYAEAAVRGGGDKAKGLEYYNKVRVRALGNVGAVRSYTVENVLDERLRELYWEGHRRTDLIRYGLFTSSNYVWDWKGGVKEGRGVENYLNIYPLPASDVLSNPENIKQNPQY